MGSYASCIVLAAFAREELGRSSILLDLRGRALGGEIISIDQIRDACEDHVTKQRAAMLSTVLQADRDSGLGKIMLAKMTNDPPSPARKKADAELKRIDTMISKRTPNDRHQARTAALYVEPMSESRWKRPTETSASCAHDFLRAAVNDYAGRYNQGYITSDDSILKDIDVGLYEALKLWSDRPTLQPPEWPTSPGFGG
jgi:AbiV family abortive infection protein